MSFKITPQLHSMLAGFQASDITEGCFSFLLAMHTWDFIELGPWFSPNAVRIASELVQKCQVNKIKIFWN